MEKKDKIEKIALRYTGAAAALLGSTAAGAQVVFTDIQDTTLDKNGQYYDLDLDTNGVMDYRITQIVDSTSADVSGVQIQTLSTTGNQVLGLDYGNYNYPFKLNVGDTIGAGKPFKGLGSNDKIGYLAFNVSDTTYPNSQFRDGVTNGFLGLRLKATDTSGVLQTHYGWVMIDVAADLKSVTIKEFGYETTPNDEILAGEGGSIISVEEVEVPLPSLAQRGGFLDIELPEDFKPGGKIIFSDLSGRQIKTASFNGRAHKLRLEGLPKGVHVATVQSNGRQASLKVVVY